MAENESQITFAYSYILQNGRHRYDFPQIKVFFISDMLVHFVVFLSVCFQGLLFLMYRPNLESALAGYVAKDTFEADVTSAMEGELEIEQKDFGKHNNEHVERYYETLAFKRNIEGGAAAAKAAVPLADVISNHVTTLLDEERMKIQLKTVAASKGSMILSQFHSRQLRKLTKSSSIHGFLYHPDLQVPTKCQPTSSDSNPRHILQRSLTICTGSLEYFAHWKCKNMDLSETSDMSLPDTAKSIYNAMLDPFYNMDIIGHNDWEISVVSFKCIRWNLCHFGSPYTHWVREKIHWLLHITYCNFLMVQLITCLHWFM